MKLHHEANKRMEAEVNFGNFCPLCAAGRYDECPEARRVMGIPETVHKSYSASDGLGRFMPLTEKPWDGIERRTLVRRRADPHSAGVLRGEVSPYMGPIAEVEPRPFNWPHNDECKGECHHVWEGFVG